MKYTPIDIEYARVILSVDRQRRSERISNVRKTFLRASEQLKIKMQKLEAEKNGNATH